MGIVSETHFIVGGVPAESLRGLARRHRPLASNGWALAFFSALERAAVDGLWVWGSEGKGLDEDFHDELEPFFAELIELHPEARAVRSEESDHDFDGSATWSELHRTGEEEGAADETASWQTSQLACKLSSFGRGEEVDTELPGAPVDEPTWALRASRVYAVLWCGYFEDAGRAALLEQLRSVRSRAEDATVRACLEQFQADLEGWDTDSSRDFPSWCHASTSIEIEPLTRALAALRMPAVIGYQPEGDTMKVVGVLGPEVITHHDLPLGFAWSPALVALAAGDEEAEAPPPPTELPIPDSPHAPAVLAELEGLSIVGLKDQPVFQRLSSLTITERRHLLLALGARAVAERSDVLDVLTYLLVDKTPIIESQADLVELLGAERVLGSMARDALVLLIERTLAEGGPSEAMNRALTASETLRERAAAAPPRPDKYERQRVACRAHRLLQAARGAARPARD